MIEDRHDSTPALLSRAMAYIDDNAHRDITLTEIASAVYVTPRALQYLFRKHRGCTPREYVRMVRLNYAHRDLVEGDRLTTTVSQIAARWGFGHIGRFAVYYRQQFGISPHQTLRD
jgi:transcriptional regulator GlxA family with amidase domain